MPTVGDVEKMPWWAPLGGGAGAVALMGGLLFASQVGTGRFNGLFIIANLLTSPAIDNFG